MPAAATAPDVAGPRATRAAGPDAPLLALADRCVQCGLCLPACPTYARDRSESESPRGRIALARAWELGTVPPTAAGDAHLDHCLGCRACEAVCPAGVEYGALLVAARAHQRRRRPPRLRQRAFEWLAARPRPLALALAAYRLLHPLLPPAVRPLPRPQAPARGSRRGIEASSAAAGRTGDEAPGVAEQAPARVFLGCVARGYEQGLVTAVQRLGQAAGLRVEVPAGQACCGTLHAHAGASDAAAALAARNRAALAGPGAVLTLASGCHGAVAAALDGAAMVVDAIDALDARAAILRFRPTPRRVALHLPCTQRNVVGSDVALRRLLARVPGLEVVELPRASGCCGAAGTAMLLEPGRAADHRAPLLAAFAASGAERLLSANIGCRLHFAGATPAPVQHPLEFLAECLA